MGFIMDIMENQGKIDCTFCKIVENRCASVVVKEDKDIMVIMDLYPATPGHALILPKRHIETIYEMPPDLGAGIISTAAVMARAIKKMLSPDGINLIQANGEAAGQTINHFHLHLVPRYWGDRVHLKFGHGDIAEKVDEMTRIASLLKIALNHEKI